MKTFKLIRQTGVALAALLVAGLPSVSAITLSYEEDPDGAGPLTIGSPYVSGPIQIIVDGRGTGTIYQPFGAPGTQVGDAGNTANGVTLMNALPGQFNPVKAIGSEDQWGIVTVSKIVDLNTGATIWTPLGKNAQVIGSFYGGTDFFGRQDNVTTSTTVQKGLTLDLYEQMPFLPTPTFVGTDPNNRATTGPGTGNTPASADYPRFTEAVFPQINLQLALRATSTTGFLDAGVAALQQTAEVVSTFVNSVGGQGSAQTYLQVVGGNSAFQFDTNGFSALFNGNTADIQVILAQQTLPFAQPWDVSINGPLQANVIPEPSSVLAGLACIMPILAGALGRRRTT